MAPQRALQVLVVDDDPGILQRIDALTPAGWAHRRDRHRWARRPRPPAEEGCYDLILCDLLMPELDGQTLYGLLQRQLPALCQR